MRKEEIRKIYLQKRLSLSEGEYAQLNFQLYQMFFSSIDLSPVKILHTFLPLAKNNEPDTWLIIDRIRREFPHIRISLPKVNAKTSTLENYFFEGLHQLGQNRWGIPEPKQGLETNPAQIDMILIPLIAFDDNGHRVGYGKGFYDKFLPLCRPDCKRIGISLFEPIEKIDDVTPHDVRLHACVTSSNFYSF